MKSTLRLIDLLPYKQVLQNPAAPRSLLESASQSDDPTIREAVARNEQCDPEWLSAFAQDKNFVKIRVAAALNSNTPHEVLARLAVDADPEVIWGVCRNTSVTPDIVARVQRGGRTDMFIAESGVVSPDELSNLARSPDVETRCRAVLNRRILEDAAVRALGDPSIRVRRLAIASASIPISIAEQMVDRGPEFGVGLARRADLPESLVWLLVNRATDSNFVGQVDLAQSLAKNSALVDRYAVVLAGTGIPSALEALARNPTCPEDLFSELVSSPLNRVRSSCMASPQADAKLAFQYMLDEAPNVRLKVASSPIAPESALAYLVADANQGVVAEVARNRLTPLEHPARELFEEMYGAHRERIRHLLERATLGDGASDERTLADLLSSSRPAVRVAAGWLLGRSLMGAADVDRFVHARRAVVRELAARYLGPILNEEQVAALLQDSNASVRHAMAGVRESPVLEVERAKRQTPIA